MDSEKKTDNLAAYLDFQVKALTEAANVVARGMAFYLAISAALAGYILTQEIGEESKKFLSVMGIIVSFFAFCACGSLGWGFYLGLFNLEKTLKIINIETYHSLDMHRFFERGRKVCLVVLGSCI